MKQRNIRRVAAAAALVTTLAVTAPAQAATGRTAKAGPDWIKTAVHWVASLVPASWMNWTKSGEGVRPPLLTSETTSPDGGDRGHGIDPDG
ncbi:MAG: hypothetical protein ACREMY_33310 [bacterium]